MSTTSTAPPVLNEPATDADALVSLDQVCSSTPANTSVALHSASACFVIFERWTLASSENETAKELIQKVHSLADKYFDALESSNSTAQDGYDICCEIETFFFALLDPNTLLDELQEFMGDMLDMAQRAHKAAKRTSAMFGDILTFLVQELVQWLPKAQETVKDERRRSDEAFASAQTEFAAASARAQIHQAAARIDVDTSVGPELSKTESSVLSAALFEVGMIGALTFTISGGVLSLAVAGGCCTVGLAVGLGSLCVVGLGAAVIFLPAALIVNHFEDHRRRERHEARRKAMQHASEAGLWAQMESENAEEYRKQAAERGMEKTRCDSALIQLVTAKNDLIQLQLSLVNWTEWWEKLVTQLSSLESKVDLLRTRAQYRDREASSPSRPSRMRIRAVADSTKTAKTAYQDYKAGMAVLRSLYPPSRRPAAK